MVKSKFNHTLCYDALHPTFTTSLPCITYPHYFTLTTLSIYNFIVKCLEIREHKGLAPELFSMPKRTVLCVQIHVSNSRQNYTRLPNSKVILLAEMQIWRNPIGQFLPFFLTKLHSTEIRCGVLFSVCYTSLYLTVDVNTETMKHYTWTPKLHISRQDVITCLCICK